MKFLTIEEIVSKLMLLSKKIRHEIQSQNYIMFKKFLRSYSLNKRLERSDMIVQHDIFQLIKTNLTISSGKLSEPVTLHPFVFYTDGGVCQNEYIYSMH